MRHQLQRLKGGSQTQSLNQAAVANFPILLPMKNRQNFVCEKLNPLLKRIMHNLAEIETLRELRDRTLPDLISGKLSIKKAN